jgi:hypothetical protein
LLSGFSFNDAYRIIKNVVDERINALVRSGAGVDILWGTVASIGTPPNTCSVYLPGETVPSTGFRLENGMKPNLLDPVRVAIDKRGNRWVEAVLNPVAGGFLDVRNNQVTGLTGGTIVAAETDGTPNATVSKLIFPPDTVSVVGGDATIRSVPQAFIGASLTLSATQPLTNITYAPISWDAETFDTDSFHSSGALTRLTIPAGLGGKYMVTANVGFEGQVTPAGFRGLIITKNGDQNSNVVSHWQNATVTGVGTYNTVSAVVDLAAGDYVQAYVYQSQGATINITSNSKFMLAKLDSGKVGQGIGVIAYHDTTIVCNSGSATLIPYNSEVMDTDGFHDTTTNNGRLTVPAGLGGLYYVIASGHHTNPTFTGYRELVILKNGVDEAATRIPVNQGSTAHGGIIQASTIVYLQPGDYLHTTFGHDAGSNIDYGYSASSSMRLRATFRMVRLDSGSMPSTPGGRNLIRNGSFEQGLAGWPTIGGSATTSAAAVTDTAYEGVYSLRYTGSGIAYGFLGQNVTVYAGRTYRLSFRMRTSGSFTSQSGAGIALEGVTGQLGVLRSGTWTNNSWEYFEKYYTITSDANAGIIATNSYGGTSTGALYIDTVMFQDMGYAAYVDNPAEIGWTNVTSGYASGWGVYADLNFTPVRYRKDALGYVHMEGLIAGGTIGTTAFQLPAGFRPGINLIFASAAVGQWAELRVNTTGDVIPNTAPGGSGWFSVACSFYAGF